MHFKYYLTKLAKKWLCRCPRHRDFNTCRKTEAERSLIPTYHCLQDSVVPCLQEDFPCHHSAVQPVTCSSVLMDYIMTASYTLLLLLLPVTQYFSAWLIPCSCTIGCCCLGLFHTSDTFHFQQGELCRSFPPFSVSVDERHTPEMTANSLPAFPQACLVSNFFLSGSVSFSPLLSVFIK